MTINEIAKMAGVSRATVSRYLNDGYVSEEKKERIAGVIAETGYIPSSQAQMLRSKKTGLIGVIIPKISSDSIGRMVDGIGEELAKEGYQLLLASTNNNEREEVRYLQTFRNNYVDGVILIGTIFRKEHRKALEELEVPVVILGQQYEGYACVYQDDCHSARDVAELLTKSCRHIAYIGVTPKDKAVGAARKKWCTGWGKMDDHTAVWNWSSYRRSGICTDRCGRSGIYPFLDFISGEVGGTNRDSTGDS